jgi:exodeoxyribonuclease-3
VISACEPDLAILQEATRPDVVQRLASACGMKAWGASRGDSLAFLSRTEVAHHGWHGVLLAKRRYLEIVPAGGHLRIFGVHLSAIHSNLTEWRRTYEIRFLLSQIQQYRQAFHVVTGDFNTLAQGEELDISRLPARLRAFTWLSGRIRWRTIRVMTEGGYKDAYRLFHKDTGYTFPTWDPHVRLDYLFAPASFAKHVMKCEVVRNVPEVKEASDHFPLLSQIAEPDQMPGAQGRDRSP